MMKPFEASQQLKPSPIRGNSPTVVGGPAADLDLRDLIRTGCSAPSQSCLIQVEWGAPSCIPRSTGCPLQHQSGWSQALLCTIRHPQANRERCQLGSVPLLMSLLSSTLWPRGPTSSHKARECLAAGRHHTWLVVTRGTAGRLGVTQGTTAIPSPLIGYDMSREQDIRQSQKVRVPFPPAVQCRRAHLMLPEWPPKATLLEATRPHVISWQRRSVRQK